MDDDALKKNTDCVYFLASPLTCKKGNDCEFRHSESARVNPRDCRYWLSGNCLNWDCPFRHPPLEGRPTITAAPGALPGGANKSRVPCYFYSQGYCAKGDKCQFMHGTPSLTNLKTAPTQRPTKATTPGSAPEPNEKESENPTTNGAEAKSVQAATLETLTPAETRPAQVGGLQSNQKDGRPVNVSGHTQNGGPRGRAEGPVVSSGLVGSRLRLRQVQPGDDRVQNGMEPDEWWEESSPGFDVLVDDGPDQSRYPDDPDFQSAGETGIDIGKVATGNRGRGGRSMRMQDESEQYDYEFSNLYDHPGSYDGVPPYDHGGYDYNVHDQQGGYDPSSAYDRGGHQRSSAYSDRVGADEMLARERLGLPMDVDMRAGAPDQRTRIVKRRRPDGGHHHVLENHSRRQRTEIPLEEYQHHQRQQEDQQKQHELHLRHQLFMQHGVRNNSRRAHEKTGLEPGIIARRALHDIGASDVMPPALERMPLKAMAKARPSNDHMRAGGKEVDIHSRLSKGVDSYGEAETRNFMDLEGNRKSEKEVRKEPSTFAGPKSLAQIRAEKRKGAVEEPLKVSESSNGLKKPVPVLTAQLKGSVVRSQPPHPSASGAVLGATSVETQSVEEKGRMEKDLTQEQKKVPSFEGPKSLSVILKEKRRVGPEMDSKSEEMNIDHLRRVSSRPSRVVVASRLETASDVGSHAPEVDTEVGAEVGYAEVEDGEFLSDEDETMKARQGDHNDRQSHSIEVIRDDVHDDVATRDSQWQEDVAPKHPQTGEGEEDEEHSNGEEVERTEEDLEYNEGQEYEEGREEHVEPEHDEDGYALDVDEEEDDFAKKLGGFFS